MPLVRIARFELVTIRVIELVRNPQAFRAVLRKRSLTLYALKFPIEFRKTCQVVKQFYFRIALSYLAVLAISLAGILCYAPAHARRCYAVESTKATQQREKPAMSRKDFRLIAETIRLLPSFETFQEDGKLYPTEVVNFSAVCRRFAEALRTTNPRFNADRFINACNGKGR